MYYFLYGEGWAHSQAEMLERGLTSDQYAEFARLQNGVLRQFEAQQEGQTGNYNMLDGRLNNEPPVKPDLTDGQTHEEIRELAPETLPEEKPSVLDRLKSERPEHEARQITPPVPERGL